LLAGAAGDDLDRVFGAHIVERRGEPGDADRRVAGCDRHRDRLGRVEEHEIDVEPLLREIALGLRDECARRSGGPGGRDGDLFRRCARRTGDEQKRQRKQRTGGSHPVTLGAQTEARETSAADLKFLQFCSTLVEELQIQKPH
jgi:hypothetical protein